MIGPKTEFSNNLHGEKYRTPNEDFREAMNRIAGKLATGDRFHALRGMLLNQRFLPAGRIQATVGTGKKTTPMNCFMSGTIGDSFTHGDDSIMAMAVQAAETMRMGGGIGFDFSTIRPRGSLITSLQSHSSGPVSFMQIYDAVCKCVMSAGHRRGAMMGVMRIDHPDIMEFIHAKQNSYSLTSFNISVGVTDEFMLALQNGTDYELCWNGHVYTRMDAAEVWETLMRSCWDWAEPGVLFLDTINNSNNLRYCESIAGVNPCGEQPLGPFAVCLLGSMNLPKYLIEDWQLFDFVLFEEDVRVAVRALDAVIDTARYPLAQQAEYHRKTRRIGLGVTGLATAIEAMGMPYGSAEFLAFEKRILKFMTRIAYRESIEMAKECGSFPLMDREKYLEEGTFASTLPTDIQDGIRRHGIRNSHLTSIAPCGTISLCADNVSSGIEPVFLEEVRRVINTPNGPLRVDLVDYGKLFMGTNARTAEDVTIDEHLDVLIAAASNVDSAVSKTLNVPADTPWEDFQEIYVRAWERGAKGCTTYQVGGKRFGILEKPEDAAACYVDPKTGRKTCD